MTTKTTPGKILIVDDEINIRKGLRAVLGKDGHTIKDAATAEEALTILATYACEVAVVDIRMPGMSGTDLLAEIRERWPHIAVILLTGHGTLDTAITAVKEGAQNYLLKPAQPDDIRQAVAEALAAARRRREQIHLLDSLRVGLQRLEELPADLAAVNTARSNKHIIKAGDIEINPLSYEVHRNGNPISLTPSEFNLLVALAERSGQVVDYTTLVRISLDYEPELWEAKELIKRHIFSLRQKIEPDPSTPQYIINVRGIGYRFIAPE